MSSFKIPDDASPADHNFYQALSTIQAIAEDSKYRGPRPNGLQAIVTIANTQLERLAKEGYRRSTRAQKLLEPLFPCFWIGGDMILSISNLAEFKTRLCILLVDLVLGY